MKKTHKTKKFSNDSVGGAFDSGAFAGAFNQLFTEKLDRQQQSDPDEVSRERFLISMRSQAPYQWMSNHIRESWRLTGSTYVAIKVLSEQAALAELKCYRWGRDARMGGDHDHKEPLPRNHPLCLFMNRPCRKYSAGYLRRQMVQQLALTGTSLNWRVDNDFGKPKELWCVPTGWYQPVPISGLYPDGAFRVLAYYPGPLSMVPGVWGAGGVVVDARSMLAIRHPHPLVPNGEGYSPQSACGLPLDTVESIDQARFSTVRRGAYPSAVVEQDMDIKQSDPVELYRIQQQLMQLLGTPDRAGAIAVLGPGQKMSSYSGAGKFEVGWLESWAQLVEFVMAIFGVNKSLAFMSEDLSYAALYAALKQFNLFTMCPLLKLIEDQLNIDLVEPFWGEDYFIELVPKKIDDDQVEEAKLANDLKCGVRLNKEIRAMRGLEILDEEWMNERAFQMQHKEETIEKDGFQDEKPEDKKDKETEKQRPKTGQGRGSLPPRDGLGKHLNGSLSLNGKH